MLSGLLNPTSGDARVLGFVPWERRNEMKRQFSLLMGQKNALWWDLPAQESLELNRAIYGIDRDRFEKVVGGLSELLEVTDKMNVMVRELSLGERMKMELISALIQDRKSTRLNSSHVEISYAVFCLKKKKKERKNDMANVVRLKI